MDLRYRLAVVTGAGTDLGRDVAVSLSRVGAAVLCVDRDLMAAERTADLVRAGRVSAWALQADPAHETDLALLAGRARDLGGADLLVTLGAPLPLTRLFLDGLGERRGRRDGSPAVVNVGPVAGLNSGAGPNSGAVGSSEYAAARAELIKVTASHADPIGPSGARVMAVVPDPATVSPTETTRTVLHLLAHGSAGEMVELDKRPAARSGRATSG